ncbi:MAG TPA: TATA-box-binding protein [Candidatus Woesearchaeota archaeon]|nr:TATA-box-binding protein [Candidatus Woesearchaeota archaeon]
MKDKALNPAVAEKKGKGKNDKDITVVNIVVSSSLGKEVPLEKMATVLANTEYNPEQFPGLVLRIKEPKTSALIFNSGNIVCTGARSLQKVRESINRIKEAVAKVGVNVTIEPKITVQNIVASGSIGMDLNLNKLAITMRNTEYEPEQFPGLVYKLNDPDISATFLLFSNGKIVCTGTKSEDAVHRAVEKLIVKLKQATK